MSEQSNYWLRPLNRRKLLRGAGVGATGLAGVALVGCGDDDDNSAGGPTGGLPATTTPVPQSTPVVRKRGGTLTFGYHQDPAFLTPRLSRSGFDNAFLLVPGDNYIYVKADGKIDAGLSLFSSSETPDASTHVGKLRPNVKFHDGTSLNARAVKAHLEYLLDATKATKFGYRSLIETIKSIDTPDETTVRINLSQPDAGFISALAVAPGIPFSIAQVDKLGDAEILNPAMTGPYKVSGYRSGSDFTFDKNPDFWGPKDKEPYLDKIVYKAITQDETRAAALEAGELDAIWFAGSNDTTLRLSKITKFQARSFQVGPTLLTVNQNKAPLTDLRLRKAISHAIDKKRILEAIYQGQGAIAKSMLPSGTYGYLDYDPFPYDVKAAKDLVSAASGGTPVKISYAFGGTPPSASAQLAASLYKQMLDAVGFDVSLENVAGSNAIFDALYTNKTHHIGEFSTGVRPDPVAQFALYSTSTAFYNAGGATTDPAQKQMDDLVSKARAALDTKEREKLVFELGKLQADNVFSQIPIVARVRWVFAKPTVEGITDPEFVNTPAGASFRARFLSLKDA